MWFDPACPWAWMTSRWLGDVEAVRPVRVRWHVMSLAVLNEGRELSPRYADLMARAWGPVRVVTAARAAHGDAVVKPLYDAMGARIHPGGRQDFAQVCVEALDEVGLPTDLAAAVDTDEHDEALRASHAEAIALVGEDVGTPVVAIDGVGYFGPVVTPAPRGEAAGRLWDGLALMTSVPGFYELKRTRTDGPIFD
ncbi:DsbA family protein [Isoptericola sp. b490]|uniref:mycothiol-dependent nitroreductase Rv2466c family protein n=1 Tax=Actinotalea lenta TaxID=3064654 RepID=UPI0027128DAD|nr:DsbA family protein [Isoptericola sp. b490]MDO8121089.1 DsbA family protein [Isoptericola sp. b490]